MPTEPAQQNDLRKYVYVSATHGTHPLSDAATSAAPRPPTVVDFIKVVAVYGRRNYGGRVL